ncbi:MAG TPA: indolepyruvate ferredoxin oxidoreductase family protein, partial [Aliiroseovarius sp.]|nr:indolepyruvate ferredoxin oxidoreductase family protein [Aliiroseovarius sp.]
AAIDAGTTMTYKILYNDAVAMTGGQPHEGGLTADRIAREVMAAGVEHLALVYDEKEEIDFAAFPPGIEKHPRAELLQVEEKFRTLPGVSVILYVQTCAAEKRRRRKRGLYPDPDRRVMILPEICEGCGDCGVQSNCVSIVPLDTELGRKRAIDQSSCNKDFSCLNGFCPSFVTVKGAQPKKAATVNIDLPDLPAPELPEIEGTYNCVITGVGGTGVVTIGAILAQAAYMDGLGAGMMEMAGLAQKGGAVTVHLKLARAPEDIDAIRVATGEAHAIIGCELVVSASHQTLGLTTTGVTGAVVDSHETITGDFTRQPDFSIPGDRLKLSLEARLRDRLDLFDATELAEVLLGDSIFSNMLVLGAAWQKGLVPIGLEAIRGAIELNGQAVEQNLRAFDLGRWAVTHPDEAAGYLADKVVELPRTLEEKIAYRADHLEAYQNKRLARKYRKLVDAAQDEELREAIALGYHKVLAYKDEYEVARLLRDARKAAQAEFDGDLELSFHMSPPLLSRPGPDGRPEKREFSERAGRWIMRMARLKWLRGSFFDPFGRTEERRLERQMIRDYEADMKRVLAVFSDANRKAALDLARLPLEVRGFGPVKMAAAGKAAKKRARLLKALEATPEKVAAE